MWKLKAERTREERSNSQASNKNNAKYDINGDNKTMALLSSFSFSPRPSPSPKFHPLNSSASLVSFLFSSPYSYPSFFNHNSATHLSVPSASRIQASASNICTQIDTSLLTIAESFYDDELWAAACLRVRSFNEFKPDTFAIQDHKRYLAEREFEAIKERLSGKRAAFGRVSCINASLPLSHISSLSDDLTTACKYSSNGEGRVVVATLDLNKCLCIPGEIAGTKPEV